MQIEKPRPLSALITEDISKIPDGRISLFEMLALFHERGFGFFLLIFALPMALPIPVPPGINIALASPLLFLTIQQALGLEKVWLPKWLGDKTMASDSFRAMLTKSLPWLIRVEKIISPRLGIITGGVFSNLIGLAGLIMALCVTIPVPMTNTIPSLGIALMAIGVLMRDGLAVILGLLIGIGWVSILVWAFTHFGAEGLDILKDWIKSLL